MLTELDLLRAARQLLLEKGWTQGAAARTATGVATLNFDPDAVCFCALGALNRARWDLARHESENVVRVAQGHLDARVPDRDIADFNDRRGRTLAEVIDVFDRAIARLEKRRAKQFSLAEVSP